MNNIDFIIRKVVEDLSTIHNSVRHVSIRCEISEEGRNLISEELKKVFEEKGFKIVGKSEDFDSKKLKYVFYDNLTENEIIFNVIDDN